MLSILEKRMKKLPKNFLYPFCICVFSNFEKIFLKSTKNCYKLYRNWINFIIINAKFSQKFSNFFPNILKILFKIYFKFPMGEYFNSAHIRGFSAIFKVYFSFFFFFFFFESVVDEFWKTNPRLVLQENPPPRSLGPSVHYDGIFVHYDGIFVYYEGIIGHYDEITM